MVEYHKNVELHESNEAMKFGLKVIAHMNLMIQRLAKHYDMRFVLEQTPAESTGYRFAKLDLKHFPEQAKLVVKGDINHDQVYYTNSTLCNVGHPMNPIERVKFEGLYHPLIEAGALTHIWLGESKPSKESLSNFVTKTFKNTQNDQIAFSPEFTTCLRCGKTARGISSPCVYCGSEEVEGITRITGYFTKISSWNQGKLAELADRFRNTAFFAHDEIEPNDPSSKLSSIDKVGFRNTLSFLS